MAIEQQALVVAHQPYHAEPIRPSVAGLSNIGALKARIDLRGLYNDLTGNPAGGVTVRSRGRRGVRVLCPFHSDSDPSLVIFFDKPDDQFYHCYTCKSSGDCVAMVMELQHVDFIGAMGYLGLRNEIKYDEVLNAGDRPKPTRSLLRVDRVTDFIYTDLDGTTLYKEVRTEGLKADGKEGKTTAYRHPAPGHPGHCLCCQRFFPEDPSKWNWHIRGWGFGMDGVEKLVPYRLPELRARADAGLDVTLVEGANKSELLKQVGIFASSNIGASGFVYPDAWIPYFEGSKRGFVFSDSDLPGRTAALDRVAFLRRCGMPAKYVDFFPDCHEGEGVDDIIRQNMSNLHAAREQIVEAIYRPVRTFEILLTDREDAVDTETLRVFPLGRRGLDLSRAVPSTKVTIERPTSDTVRNQRFFDEIERAYALRDVPLTWQSVEIAAPILT